MILIQDHLSVDKNWRAAGSEFILKGPHSMRPLWFAIQGVADQPVAAKKYIQLPAIVCDGSMFDVGTVFRQRTTPESR